MQITDLESARKFIKEHFTGDQLVVEHFPPDIHQQLRRVLLILKEIYLVDLIYRQTEAMRDLPVIGLLNQRGKDLISSH